MDLRKEKHRKTSHNTLTLTDIPIRRPALLPTRPPDRPTDRLTDRLFVRRIIVMPPVYLSYNIRLLTAFS